MSATIMAGVDLAAGLTLAAAFGGMTFFSAVMAPLIFVKLPGETAGRFIREVFPWYYMTMGGVTALSALLLALGGPARLNAAMLACLVTLGFWFARQDLMPRINHARDHKQPDRFKWLHRLSVWVNGAQWLLLAAALVLVLG